MDLESQYFLKICKFEAKFTELIVWNDEDAENV